MFFYFFLSFLCDNRFFFRLFKCLSNWWIFLIKIYDETKEENNELYRSIQAKIPK